MCASCISISARLAMEASVCGWRLPSTSRQPARASRLRGSASRSMSELPVERPRSLSSTARLLTLSSVSGCRSPRLSRLTESDSRRSGSASSSLPRSQSSCEWVSMAVTVSGCRSPSVARQPSSFCFENGSASSSLRSWCSSNARLFTASSVSVCRGPSFAARPSHCSRSSGSAADRSPCSCSSEATWSSSRDVERSAVGILSRATRASPRSQRWMPVISRAANSAAPPSSASIPLWILFFRSAAVHPASALRQPPSALRSHAVTTSSMRVSRASCSRLASASELSTANGTLAASTVCSCHTHQP
mmetsp:Transcript_31430/g.101635  ORF Transcript_31430/g.101635 Transcript_31430/m.101635 type:complete len:305 (-) Transcript_31430:1353-2267(-)